MTVPRLTDMTPVERIAARHNALRKAVLEGGAITHTPGGWETWGLGRDEYGAPPSHLHLPADRDVTPAQVQAWLDEDRREREQRLLAEHTNAGVRRMEQDAQRGFKTGAARCDSCNSFKSGPLAVCTQCGDEPGSHNMTPREEREFRQAHGRSA